MRQKNWGEDVFIIPLATSHMVNDELSYEADAKYVMTGQGNFSLGCCTKSQDSKCDLLHSTKAISQHCKV